MRKEKKSEKEIVLEQYHPGLKKEITSEAHLEKIILKNWNKIFPFNFYAKRKKISKRSIVDIIGKSDNNYYLIELKYRPIRKTDALQIKKYIKDFKQTYGVTFFKQFLIDYNHKTERVNIYAI